MDCHAPTWTCTYAGYTFLRSPGPGIESTQGGLSFRGRRCRELFDRDTYMHASIQIPVHEIMTFTNW
jgi:hypothetical protein